MYLALAAVVAAIVLGLRLAAARWPVRAHGCADPRWRRGATALAAALLIGRDHRYATVTTPTRSRCGRRVLAHRRARPRPPQPGHLAPGGGPHRRSDDALSCCRGRRTRRALCARLRAGSAGPLRGRRARIGRIHRAGAGRWAGTARLLSPRDRPASPATSGRRRAAHSATTIRMAPRNPDAYSALAESSLHRAGMAMRLRSIGPSWRDARERRRPAGTGARALRHGQGRRSGRCVPEGGGAPPGRPGCADEPRATRSPRRADCQEAIDQYRAGRTMAPSNARR